MYGFILADEYDTGTPSQKHTLLKIVLLIGFSLLMSVFLIAGFNLGCRNTCQRQQIAQETHVEQVEWQSRWTAEDEANYYRSLWIVHMLLH